MYKFLFLALGSAFWPTPLVAETTLFCRDFSGGVPSDLRSPWRVGRPAGADLVGTCAGDGKVEIYDMLRPPGANTPSMLRGDDVCSDVMLHFVNVCQQAWCTWDLGEALFICVFGQGAQPATRDNWHERSGHGPLQRVIRTGMLRHGTWRLRSC